MAFVAKSTCIDDQVEFAAPDVLPVKNTFVHFGHVGSRSLRACQSAPADPIFPQTSQLEHPAVREGFTEPSMADACVDAEDAADLSVDTNIAEVRSIPTLKLTSPCSECPAKGEELIVQSTESPVEGEELPVNNIDAHIEEPVKFLADGLPIKDTFIHFGRVGPRSLRTSQSEPVDPLFPPTGKRADLDGEKESAEYYISGACLDVAAMTDTTDDRSSFDLELDFEVLSIQTPELTPRHLDSPMDSLSVSLTSSPSTWCPQPQVEQQHLTEALLVQGAQNSLPAFPTSLDLLSKPALTSTPAPTTLPSCFCSAVNITLRLAEKGKLGVFFANSLGNDTLVVNGILPGQAVHSWNRQCMFGNSDNITRYVALGDVLLSVNGKTYWQDMLQECEEQLLLKMTFGRMDPWASFGSYSQYSQNL